MRIQRTEESCRKTVQLLLLIAAGIVIYPLSVFDGLFPGYGAYVTEKFFAVPCLLFVGSALGQRLTASARRCLLLSAAMILWFVTAQTQHWLSDMGTRNFGIFAVGYLLAFPFATVNRDSRGTGLKWIGSFYLAHSLLMVVFTGMLLLDAVPEMLAACVKWEGTRISVFSHPNGGGCMLMLGIGFSLYFMTLSGKKWEKCLMAVLTVLQFFALILTSSRTTILLVSAMVGGTLFFVLWDGGWKRFLIGAAAALAVIVTLFSLSRVLYDLHTEMQINKLILQMEQESEAHPEEDAGEQNQNLHYDEETGEYNISGTMVSVQGTLAQDMGTMNGRTYIWKAAFTALEDNPAIKTWGTEYVAAEISYRNIFPVVNAHNSWIQILMLLGMPAFALAMVFTLAAVWNIWKLMWRVHEDLSRKVAAMIVICILAASLLEVYLFTGEAIFSNFIFFLCTGYLIQWNAEASGKG